METKSRKKSKKKTVLVPPKKNKNNHLSRDEVRSINKKKMSRRRKLKKHILTVLLAVAVMCVGIVLVFSLFFRINTITVSGDRVYSDKMVIENSEIVTGKNLFRVNEKQVSERLSQQSPFQGQRNHQYGLCRIPCSEVGTAPIEPHLCQF